MSDSEIIRRLMKEIQALRDEQARLASLVPLYDVGNHDTVIATLSAGQNDYSVGDYDSIIRSASTPVTITGIAGGVLGRTLFITVLGANSISFAHQNASSVATNRIVTLTALTVAKTARQTLMLLYIAHDTGNRWIQVV